MSRQDLFEYAEPKVAALQIKEGEGDAATKSLVLAGIAIQGDIRNRNGRIYPAKEIERAVLDMKAKINEFGPILGESDHPDNLQISLSRVSHLIKDVWMEGANGLAKFEVLPVGEGEIITSMVRHGAKIGVSSRGSGAVDHDGMVSDFEIVTIDIVANPSAPGAYPKPILESMRRTKTGQEAVKLAEALRHDDSAQKHFLNAIDRFLAELNPKKV
jgi:hypothetical protein